jgi:peroxiredoxin Q/BCP
VALPNVSGMNYPLNYLMSDLKKELEIGDLAPPFSLHNQNNELITLSSFVGQWVVVYFYPKDFTPGCTTQACDFRDHIEKLPTNMVIFGISKDSPKKHLQFKNEYQLPFDLLSDGDHKVHELYGTWIEKSMYGKKYFGSDRSTFLIDPHGTIQFIWRTVKVTDHVKKIIQKTQEINN